MLTGEHGASYGHHFSTSRIRASEWSKLINQFTKIQDSTSSTWMEQISPQLTSTRSVIRACLGWVFELGINSEMPYYLQKNLALINISAFISLLLALPGTIVLMIMGFGHPFSLLISGVLGSCLILSFNGARRVEWSKALFAFLPSSIIVTYTLLELPTNGFDQPLNYLLARQGLCFSLLIPIVIYGFEGRQKIMTVIGLSLILFLSFDVASMRLGAFQGENITGLNHGLFSALSLVQYAALAGYVIYMQNYTLQHARQAQLVNDKLKRMAIRDGLTGLYNHSFMEQMTTDAINRSRRTGNPLALLMIDIDSFKQINDTFGHNAGDDVLLRLTQVLKSSVRSTDYLGRWGGDEMILLLTDTNLSGANNLAEKLRSLVEGYVFPYSKQLTISLGVSEYRDGDCATNLIARADAAMYRSKRAGRNRVEIQANGHFLEQLSKDEG